MSSIYRLISEPSREVILVLKVLVITDTESASSNTGSCATSAENVGSESGDTEGVEESDSEEEGTVLYIISVYVVVH